MSEPMCWVCPVCSFVDTFQWSGPHYTPDQSELCAVEMVTALVVREDAPREEKAAILRRLDPNAREGWVHRPVLEHGFGLSGHITDDVGAWPKDADVALVHVVSLGEATDGQR